MTTEPPLADLVLLALKRRERVRSANEHRTEAAWPNATGDRRSPGGGTEAIRSGCRADRGTCAPAEGDGTGGCRDLRPRQFRTCGGIRQTCHRTPPRHPRCAGRAEHCDGVSPAAEAAESA